MISREDIKYIARLSKLSFDENEEEKIIEHLNKVLKDIEKINDLKTDDVEITVNPYYIENEYREDEIEESLKLERILENAPESNKEYIVVPKVIE